MEDNFDFFNMSHIKLNLREVFLSIPKVNYIYSNQLGVP